MSLFWAKYSVRLNEKMRHFTLVMMWSDFDFHDYTIMTNFCKPFSGLPFKLKERQLKNTHT